MPSTLQTGTSTVLPHLPQKNPPEKNRDERQELTHTQLLMCPRVVRDVLMPQTISQRLEYFDGKRYAFIREIASTRSLLAIGVACFRRMADGTDAKQVKYEARVFDLSLLSQVRGTLFLTFYFYFIMDSFFRAVRDVCSFSCAFLFFTYCVRVPSSISGTLLGRAQLAPFLARSWL